MKKRMYLTFLGMLCGMGAFAQVITLDANGRAGWIDADSMKNLQDTLKIKQDTLKIKQDTLKKRVLPADSVRAAVDSLQKAKGALQPKHVAAYVDNDAILALNEASFLTVDSTYFESDSTYLQNDSTLFENDSTYFQNNSLYVPNDSLSGTGDTMRLGDMVFGDDQTLIWDGDSLRLASDFLREVHDSLQLKQDSLRTVQDSLRTAQDSLRKNLDSLWVKSDTLQVAGGMSGSGETKAVKKPQKPLQSPAVKAFYRQLNELSASYFAYFRLWDDLDVPMPRRIQPNPGFYKLFVPPTFYEAPIREALEINWTPEQQVPTPVDSLLKGKRNPYTDRFYQLPNLETLAAADRWSNAILRKFYMQHPDRLVNNELYLKDLKPLEDDMIVRAPRKEKVLNFLEPEAPVENLNADNELLVLRPNFWKHKGNGYLNFTQHYISDNWYKGGESTNALLGGLVLEANFDDRQRLEFENKLEIKLGFITAPSDTVHEYKTNADLFRLNSKLGVKAFKNWYYTVAAEFKTQFFANYKTNTNNMISNFLSPAQLDITLGMDFKQNKKNYSLSLLGSPLAYSFIYIGDDNIYDPSAFNVDPGHRTANLFGSKFTGNLKWKIIPSIIWESKLEYFTTYEKVIASWENTFNFVLNRYLSTRIFVHARYDDGVTLKKDEKSYFQLQELLSFGINYTW